MKCFLGINLVLIFAISSCSEPKQTNIEKQFKEEQNLNVIKLNHNPEDIIYPIINFMAINNQIITTGIYCDYVFNLYTTTAPYKWQGAVIRGRGNNELVYTGSVNVYNDTLYFSTPGNGFRRIGNITAASPLIETLVIVKGTNDFFNLFKTNDGYIANGIILENDSQFACLNNDFSVRPYFDRYPTRSEDNHSQTDLAMGLQGAMRFLADRNHFI